MDQNQSEQINTHLQVVRRGIPFEGLSTSMVTNYIVSHDNDVNLIPYQT